MNETGKPGVRSVSLRTYMISILAIFTIIFAGLAYYTATLPKVYSQMLDYYAYLRSCETGAVELNLARVDLSRQASRYVRTAEVEYMWNYFTRIRDTKEMEATLEKLFEENGEPPAASASLEAAIRVFDLLREREIYAMKLTAVAHGVEEWKIAPAVREVSLTAEDAALTPEQMQARAEELMEGEEYARIHQQFQNQTQQFQRGIVWELEQNQQATDDTIQAKMTSQRVSILMLTVICVLACLGTIRGILRPLESFVRSIRENKPLPVVGIWELRRLALSYNETYAWNVAHQEELRSRAEQDPMTGLMNQGAYDVLKQRLSQSSAHIGLLVVDVDQFKHINDVYGHEVGNETLKKVASLLRESFRAEDYVIRYGGDEFVVVIMGGESVGVGALERRIDRINDCLQNPSDGLPPVSLSVGAAFSENGFQEELFQHADRAMYQVKRKGRCGFAVYREESAPADARRGEDSYKPRILLVDDSEINREMLTCMLEDEYEVFQAVDGDQAIDLIGKKGYDLSLVLLDLMMPGRNGFAVLEYLRAHRWNEVLPVIVISSETDPQQITRAYDMGAVDFIGRPYDTQIVRRRVTNTVQAYLKNRRLTGIITQKIREQSQSYGMMLSVLSQVVEFRNQESGNHVIHIGFISELLLDRLMQKGNPYGLTAEDAQQISFASALHDIGKIAIPDEIINKPGRLTPAERAIMQTHSAAGAEMLDRVEGYANDPLIRRAWEICRWHHERYDGKGYPDRLVGDAIPIAAQVVSVADVYDALTSERCYKKAFSHEKAMDMILNGECGTFNPLLLECLTEIADQLEEMMNSDVTRRKLERDAERMAEEMSRYRELDVSSRLLRQFRFERVRGDYYGETVSDYTFDYRVEADVLNLSPALAALAGIEELTLGPGQDSELLRITGRDGEQWADLIGGVSPREPDCTVTIPIRQDGQERACKCCLRTVWSEGENPQYLGVVGYVEPS